MCTETIRVTGHTQSRGLGGIKSYSSSAVSAIQSLYRSLASSQYGRASSNDFLLR